MLGGPLSPPYPYLLPPDHFLDLPFIFLTFLREDHLREMVCSFHKGPGSKEPTVSGLCALQRGPHILVQLTLSVLSSEKGFWEGSWSIPPPMLKPRIKFSP